MDVGVLRAVCCAGMDNGDNVEGFMAEKAGVIRHTSSSSSSSKGGSSGNSKDSSEPDLLSGLPYRVSSSMSASKDQTLVQVRQQHVLHCSGAACLGGGHECITLSASCVCCGTPQISEAA